MSAGIHDLNADPVLPFADDSFDAALCTVSIEYLRRPLEVCAQMCRVLKPGAAWINMWSERWFPTKVTRIWTQLHAFERLGFVSELYRRSGFDAIETLSLRGLPRPSWDDYAGQTPYSDSLFAVSGVKSKRSC